MSLLKIIDKHTLFSEVVSSLDKIIGSTSRVQVKEMHKPIQGVCPSSLSSTMIGMPHVFNSVFAMLPDDACTGGLGQVLRCFFCQIIKIVQGFLTQWLFFCSKSLANLSPQDFENNANVWDGRDMLSLLGTMGITADSFESHLKCLMEVLKYTAEAKQGTERLSPKAVIIIEGSILSTIPPFAG